jgi:hypothetical protein
VKGKVAYAGRTYQMYRTWKLPTVDTQFRQGFDTMEIAERTGIPEARVLRRINAQRSKRLGLPNPYSEQE